MHKTSSHKIKEKPLKREQAPSAVNLKVGNQLRLRRTILGFSQAALGKMVGITFQQVQKYESGANAMNAEKLLQCAQLLGVPVSYFFEGMEVPASEQLTAAINPHHVSEREKLELIRSYSLIPSRNTRKKIADLIHGLRE